MTRLVVLTPTPRQLFLNPSSGAPASGFKVFTYAGGTTTKLATYTDATGNTQNTNPIILDTLGECDIWIPPNTAYKFVFSPPTDTDPPTNAIWTRDGITGPYNDPVVPTTVTYASGTGSYASGPGVAWVKVRMIGGFGGGGGSGTSGSGTNGSIGTKSSFNGIDAAPGSAGLAAGPASAQSGNGAGSATFRAIGAGGQGGAQATSSTSALGGYGQGSQLGGQAGTGGAMTNISGVPGASAGGSPEYVEIILPAGTYAYTVGVGGAGGAAGTSGNPGMAGSNGVITVEEHYNF